MDNESVECRRLSNLADNRAFLERIKEEIKAAGLDDIPASKTIKPVKRKRRDVDTISSPKRLRTRSVSRRVTRSRSGSLSSTASSSSTDIDDPLVVTLGWYKPKTSRSKVAPKVYIDDLPRVDEITPEHLDNVAVTVADKEYDSSMGTTCHQCRQKTSDMKSICRGASCSGLRGRFCGPCLRNRYGQDVREVLVDPDWLCPPCRGRCNCSICRRKSGVRSTGILINEAKHKGFDNVDSYLASLQKR